MSTRKTSPAAGTIRVGIGGWNYDPWHTTFYPSKTSKKAELAYASRHVTAIEVNATYYRTQSAASFARWRDETPDDFVFSMKASRFATNRRVLAEAGESIGWFVGSGIVELGDKLGPIVWQFMPTKQFDAEDFAAFVALLPREIGGRRLRHALDVRHASFCCEPFVDLARAHDCAIVFSDSDEYPMIADATSDFVYARLMRTRSEVETGYEADDLDRWAAAARAWAAGETPPTATFAKPAAREPRDVFAYFISGAKERAPAAAMALLERLRT